MNYPINNIYNCIQGEGCLTGVPMIMLRLHGCGVGCPWCDTKETWVIDPEFEVNNFSDIMGATPYYTTKCQSEIAYYLTNNHSLQWVLMSGGEPAGYDLAPLVIALHDAGYKVAIETSGTELGHIGAGFDWVCVSPKFDMPGGKVVQAEAISVADEIKQVVGRQSDIDRLNGFLQTVTLKPGCQICLQPVSQSGKATKLCIDTIQANGWRLSVQMHKYLGLT
jgi:7-carboxy-7-deazaguanine synthase